MSETRWQRALEKARENLRVRQASEQAAAEAERWTSNRQTRRGE